MLHFPRPWGKRDETISFQTLRGKGSAVYHSEPTRARDCTGAKSPMVALSVASLFLVWLVAGHPRSFNGGFGLLCG